MSPITSVKKPPFEAELEALVGDCQSLLDVGCGPESPIKTFSKRIHTVGVDAFEANLHKSRDHQIHDDYVSLDIRKLEEAFKPDSFDCVMALDVIEHLDKAEGEKLLASMERIARKKIIVFTPNGFLPQGMYESNPWQVHLSGWTAEEMKQKGYEVIGLRGWKPLRGPYATIRYRPKFFWLFVSSLSQPWVRRRPEKAFQLLCVKNKSQR